jgi:hypothetical protein
MKVQTEHGMAYGGEAVVVLYLMRQPCEQEKGLVRKLTMTLTAAAVLLGPMALQANAQNQQRGAATIHALKNATPIVTPAACNGGTGYCGCGPGWISACAPRCCRCVPCW